MHTNAYINAYNVYIILGYIRWASLTIQNLPDSFCANLGFDTPNFIKILGEGSGICREPVKRVDTIVESCNVTKIIKIMCMYVYTHIYIYILYIYIYSHTCVYI